MRIKISSFRSLRHSVLAFLGLVTILWSESGFSQNSCAQVFASSSVSLKSSYNEVLAVMKREPYDPNNLPVIPITLFQKMGRGLLPKFNVATRSREILNDKRDFREQGEAKPIHPMGVGFEGVLEMLPSRWSGVFSGGQFRVLARASISQGNPSKWTESGAPQTRTSALAIKIFNESDPNKAQNTANIVFNNDLNGILSPQGTPQEWTSVAMTNQPTFDPMKIRHGYEVLTLIGVAYGSLSTRLDRLNKAPYINPLLRPVHSMSELGVEDVSQIKTPIWVMLVPSPTMKRISRDDFRKELVETTQENNGLVYNLLASDKLDRDGNRIWENVGVLTLTNPILSKGVDQNILFAHDSLKSAVTGLPLEMPLPDKNQFFLPDDIQ